MTDLGNHGVLYSSRRTADVHSCAESFCVVGLAISDGSKPTWVADPDLIVVALLAAVEVGKDLPGPPLRRLYLRPNQGDIASASALLA